RSGGIVAFVTSHYTMDAKSPEVRKYLAKRAELLGAVRLPDNAFRANAGTDVVSDILFLQKRDRPIDTDPDWVHLGRTADGFAVNSYFLDHPEMVLGTFKARSTQYGRDELTVKPIEGADLGEQLHEALSHIEGTYLPVTVEREKGEKAPAYEIPADPNVKNYSFAEVGGEVYFRENSVMSQVNLTDSTKERMVGLIGLRRIVSDLIDYQMDDRPDEDIRAKQAELNTAYDSFTKKFGLINSRGNARVFEEDSSYYLLCSLENIDEDGNLLSKADMFTKRTIRSERTLTHVDTPGEALAVSIGERGAVDMGFMSSLLGTPGEYGKIIEELRGVIFKDPLSGEMPDRGWQTADEYLSGNVRKKLKIAQNAARKNDAFAVNVEALEKAQPKDLEASEIDVRLGATWVDAEYIDQFMYETFGTAEYLKQHIGVKFAPYTAGWQISNKTMHGAGNVSARVTYGTDRMNAYEILEDTLNLKDVRVYDYVEDAEGRKRRVLNNKETTLAAQKQTAIKNA
ncbi:MAG: helicase, partial [Lachnospiraceae bacterium]|nr:helicase [Lachnospiraceae bacterium]